MTVQRKSMESRMLYRFQCTPCVPVLSLEAWDCKPMCFVAIACFWCLVDLNCLRFIEFKPMVFI